jgi:hypothetical protein
VSWQPDAGFTLVSLGRGESSGVSGDGISPGGRLPCPHRVG